jgi:predicted alpha/beta-hydrolase family hydrolase
MQDQTDGQVIALWQSPSGRERGIMLLAHGCGHAATHFWPQSSACRSCIGLPEELRVVSAALRRGLVAVAVSSTDRRSGCWSARDAGRVRAVLASVRRELAMPKAPLYVLGASSGGRFALMMPSLGFELKGIVAQVMGVPVRALVPQPFPPTLFVHMPRDAQTARAVGRCVRALREARVRVHEIQATPLPIDEAFFSRRIDGISEGRSAALVRALASRGLLEPDSSLLRMDPRRSRWADALAPLVGAAQLIPDQSPIAEELNVAYARHELTADHMVATLDFLLLDDRVESGSAGAHGDARAGSA